MANISKADLFKAIKVIIKGADLSSLSAKKVRKALEEKFDADFTDRKKEIDEATMTIVKQLTEGGSDDESEEEEPKSNGADAQDSSDDGLSDVEPPPPKKAKPEKKKKESVSSNASESDVEPPPPKKAKPEKKKKESVSSNASEDGDGEDDEDIARRLQEEENSSRRPSRAVAKQPKKQRKKREPSDGEKKKKSAYSKPCSLSPALAEVMGANQMARSEVVKKMWAIIKERNLQDPKNKQFMLCDDQLFNVFKKKRVKTFGMMKILRNHIFDLHQ